MLVKTKKLNMPIDIECNLFEKLVFPILLYGCEIWGFHCVNMFSIIYTITLKLFISGEYKTQWLSRVKCILDNCGLSYIWLNQNRMDKSKCKSIIHKRIEDIAHQKWFIDLSNSSMCITYKLFKKQLHFEKHLLNSNFKDRISLTRLRCSNSKLPIYNTIYLYDAQKCTLCNLDVLGDEYHYVLSIMVKCVYKREHVFHIRSLFNGLHLDKHTSVTWKLSRISINYLGIRIRSVVSI